MSDLNSAGLVGISPVAAKHNTQTRSDSVQHIPTQYGVQTPVVEGIEIHRDTAGRVSLNSLHRASGAAKHKKPSVWLRNPQSKELVAEVECQSHSSCLLYTSDAADE